MLFAKTSHKAHVSFLNLLDSTTFGLNHLLHILYVAVTELVQAAKVLLWLEYDASDEKSDPTLSSVISTPPWKRLRFWEKKKIETTHLAEFRECNISITNVCAELNWEVEKTPLIDVTLYEKNIDSWAHIPHRVQQCQLPFLSILHPLNPVPSTMKVEQICWHWSCLPGWPNFLSAWERRLSPKILTDNCIYYFLFTSQ